jgi:hypothetical protein
VPTCRGPAPGGQRWDGFNYSDFGPPRTVPCGPCGTIWIVCDRGLAGFEPDHLQNTTSPFKYIIYSCIFALNCWSTENWVTEIQPITHVSCIGYVSDTGAGVIHVQYAPDTPAGVSEYPNNSDTSRYAPYMPPIRPWYVHDIFLKIFGGFSQEYAPDTRRYAPILLWYVPEWNLYHVLCVAIAFQLFIYQ